MSFTPIKGTPSAQFAIVYDPEVKVNPVFLGPPLKLDTPLIMAFEGTMIVPNVELVNKSVPGT